MMSNRPPFIVRCNGVDYMRIEPRPSETEDARGIEVVPARFRAMLDEASTPVLYWHDADDGPPVAAIVDPEWLSRVWEAATGTGGYEEPSVTDAGREARFMPHEHSTPEDRT